MTSLRLIVAGSPDAAVPTLSALSASDHVMDAVITRPPTPQGRKRVLTPTPVERVAREWGHEVLTATVLRDIEPELLARDVDLGVIVAYGGLVREPLLSWPRLGWINLHFSLLPQWRGAAPVQHAIIEGDTTTGLSVFQLTEGLDEGPLFAQQSETIGAHDTAGSLLTRLSERGAAAVLEVVGALAAGTAVAVPQTGEPTLAPKLTRDDGRVRWTDSVDAVVARIRGVTPEPGAFTTTADGRIVKILHATIAHDAPPLQPGICRENAGRALVGTGSGTVELLRVQPAGKAAMSASDWMRGQQATSGVVFA